MIVKGKVETVNWLGTGITLVPATKTTRFTVVDEHPAAWLPETVMLA